MSERRYSDYGRFFQAEDIIAAASFLFGPGVLIGNGLAVSTDGSELEISAGAVITNDGVTIHNDVMRDYPISPQSDATIFTIVQLHSFDLSSAGQESTYDLMEYLDGSTPKFGTYADLVDADGVISGVILGWIRYPGSNVDYDDYMLHEAPKLKVRNDLQSSQNIYWPMVIPAPFTVAPGVLLALDADVTLTHTVDAQERPESTFTNTHGGTTEDATVYLHPRFKGVYPLGYLALEGLVISDPSVSLSVSITDPTGTTVIATITGPSVGDTTIAIPDSFIGDAPATAGVEWAVKIVATLPPSESFTLRRASVYAGPLPYAAA